MPIQSVMPAVCPDAPGALAGLAVLPAAGGGLLECLAAVPDPRDPRGIRHRLPVVLGLCQAAVTAGCTALADICAWAQGAPQDLLELLGARQDAAGRRVPPHPDTRARGSSEYVP